MDFLCSRKIEMILDGVFHRPVIHKEQNHVPHFAFGVVTLYEKPQVLKLTAIALLSHFGVCNANICLIFQTSCGIINSSVYMTKETVRLRLWL